MQLLRCPGIKDGGNTKYFLTKEGEQQSNRDIERAGIAQRMADMIRDETLGANESFGIINSGEANEKNLTFRGKP